ncbi:hypothetical protein RD792_008938 [Penstemon davidsonii]|uniref:Pectinesterase catalytic domain-containing protein n=1 Tax=Penstemon davidsonii TaxID=160366 RepID=A0ABR0DBV8_9LAMI|nr:hypothetical protein RD792_008938 [Penstemon davidsonii]
MSGPSSILQDAAFSLSIPLLRFTIFKTCSANAQPDYITWCNKTPRPTDCRTLIQRFYPDASNFLVKTESYFQVMAASAAYYAATDAHKLLFYAVNDGKFKTKTESEKARWKNCYQYIRAAQEDLLYARSAFNASLALKSLVKAPGHVAECERQFTDKGIRDALAPKLDTLKKSIETAIAINNNTSLSKTGRKLLEKHQNRVVVAQDGSGNYRSIQEAVNAASRRPVNGRFEIYVKKGCYNEQVKVEGPHAKDITIVGDGIGNTVITGDKHVQSKKQHTSETAVICVKAPGFIAKFITFATMGGPVGTKQWH